MITTRISSLSLKQFLKKEIANSKRILDIGCGDGAMALCLISSLDCHVDGIDLGKGKVHRANERFRNRSTKGLAICYNTDSKNINNKFPKNTFDAILVIHTLHHLTDLSDVLLKARYVLKSGGKIFIGEYQRDYGEKIDNCPRFSNAKIKSMLRTAGFRNARNHNIHKNFIVISATKGAKKV